MKYITFTVPCYNSQDYMRHCIDNLVTAGDEVEVIIMMKKSKLVIMCLCDYFLNTHLSC